LFAFEYHEIVAMVVVLEDGIDNGEERVLVERF
jgi:hypothetical protein